MDRNLMTGIWFDWMNVNNRVHGWGSKENPLRKGLDSWKSASGQDAHSWTETLEIPAEIREAIQARKTIPQWLQPPGAVEAAPPGPRQENKR